ncbi:MAG TPA: two-component regulator propeller domain-containing protein [Chitinophagaceae bacterium]|nr:two-component regulator propeller domain-containing protein [Chitinophagaceae bacterium]
MPKYLKYIYFIFSAIASLAIQQGQAQFIKTFSIEESNHNIRITRLFVSHSGWIYAGTNEGLYRFDGINFKKIPLSDTLKNYPVSSINEINNQLWVGLGSGHIYTIENNQSVKFNPPEGLPKVAINDILADKQNNIWIATSGEGIYCFKNDKLYNWNSEDDGLSDNYVYDLEADENGNIVAGTDQGLSFCQWNGNKKQVTRFNTTNGLPDNIVRVIKLYKAQKEVPAYFILGFQDRGIGEFIFNKDGSHKIRTQPADWPSGQINDLKIINSRLVVATDAGWFTTDLTSQVTKRQEMDLPKLSENRPVSMQVSSLAIDKEGNIWISFDDRLALAEGNKVINLAGIPEADPAKIHAMLYTSSVDGSIYFWTTDDKKIVRSRKVLNNLVVDKVFPIKGIDEKTEITSLYKDPYENIWVGTMGKGIFVLNPFDGSYRNINEDSLLYNGSILSITGKNNEIWISSLAGAIKCTLADVNTSIRSIYHFTNYNEVSGIGTNYIYTIFIDSRNRVWFGTDGKGLAVFEKGIFKSYNKKQGINDEVIYSITEDDKGNIWFSTSSAGLYKFDGKQFVNFGLQEGLSDLAISSLLSDKKGSLLVTNKRGIDIINTDNGLVYYLDNEAGVEEPNATLNCITNDDNGNIYFSTAKGIFSYNPSQNKLYAQVTTLLDEVSLFLQPIDHWKENTFTYDQNNFTFHFTGLYYTNPEKVQFQYRLDGFNTEWFSTKDRFASFPKLPPGNYTFRVRASLNNNFSAANEAIYTFTISKPFWKEWWFLLLLVIVMIMLFFSIMKYRERELKKWQQLQQEKLQFQFETLKNQVNPHFLFNSFNTLISVIEENPQNAVEYVEQLSDFYRTIVTTREKELIPLEEELSLTNKYFFIQQKRFGNSLNYRVTLSEEDIKNIHIPPLTLQLLAENAIKHNAISKETPLTFEIFRNNSCLVVQNNINEKINKEPSAGIGLPNITHRYRLLSGKEVKVENDHQTFKVLLPVL